MFNRKNRLPVKSIKPLYRNGKKFKGKGFIVHFKETNAEPRFTVVVSKKVDKRAVVRNRIKRVFREALRLQVKEEQIDSGDYILTVLPYIDKEIKSAKARSLIQQCLSA